MKNGALKLGWAQPLDSLYTQYTIKYRTLGGGSETDWSEVGPVPSDATEFTLSDLEPGEKFEIQVLHILLAGCKLNIVVYYFKIYSGPRELPDICLGTSVYTPDRRMAARSSADLAEFRKSFKNNV